MAQRKAAVIWGIAALVMLVALALLSVLRGIGRMLIVAVVVMGVLALLTLAFRNRG